MEAIWADALTKQFGEHVAVDHLNLTVHEGEIFGLVGPDGAGKSTVIRMLAAIMEPTAGDAWVKGFHTVKEAAEVKEHIAYMSQQFGLYQDLTVLENIEFYADLYGVPKEGRMDKINELLGFSYMRPFKKRLAGNLSGGMKQKLQLMCALVHTPDVLLLDEPTNGVDPVSRRDFWRILNHMLKEGVTIFVSTAYLDEAERCNRLGLMHEGRLIALGRPTEVKEMMRGTIVELRSMDTRRIVELLRRELPQLPVGMFGDRVHIVTTEPEWAVSKAESVIRAAGLEIDDIRQVSATLEDVFISALTDELLQAPEQRREP